MVYVDRFCLLSLVYLTLKHKISCCVSLRLFFIAKHENANNIQVKTYKENVLDLSEKCFARCI